MVHWNLAIFWYEISTSIKPLYKIHVSAYMYIYSEVRHEFEAKVVEL